MSAKSSSNNGTRGIQFASLNGKRARCRFGVANCLIPFGIFVTTAVLATIVILQEIGDSEQLRFSAQKERRKSLQNCRDHLVEYFDVVYSTLLAFSLNKDVVAMRRDSHEELQRLYDYQWARHRLTEIYVIERDFKMEGKPFLTFERESENESVDEIHSPDREQDEYRAQIEQIHRFAAEPQLKGLLSNELKLCTSEDDEETELGYVYSVPIRSANGLVGIVAGMIESKTILQILKGSGGHHPVLLVNESGDVLATEEVNAAILSDFHQKLLGGGGAASFFAGEGGAFDLGELRANWQQANILSEKPLWIVYLYHPNTDFNEPMFLGMPGHYMLAGSMLLLGATLASFIWTIGRRLEEQRLYMVERRQLEWQVQEGSERIQRSIGESIHEDLCQRLTGIAALSTSLSKRLHESAPAEANLSAEITDELKQSLSNALQLADELQHVSLQQHGFVAAVRKLADRVQRQSGIKSVVHEVGMETAPDISIATQLYRIIQEAAQNSVRHAQATQITIELVCTGAYFQISVEDNGNGNAEAIANSPGMGLRIIHYRSEMIGAQLQILPAKSQGVRLVCRCPIQAPHAAS